MSLNSLRRAAYAAGLNHVRVKCSLHQPADTANQPFDPMRLFIKNFNEFPADNFAFSFRINHARELLEEPLGSIHCYEVQSQPLAQGLLYFLEFIFAQHAVVHKHASQAITQNASHKSSGYG